MEGLCNRLIDPPPLPKNNLNPQETRGLKDKLTEAETKASGLSNALENEKELKVAAETRADTAEAEKDTATKEVEKAKEVARYLTKSTHSHHTKTPMHAL